MVINVHSHVFNFSAVYSEKALKIIKTRLIKEWHVPLDKDVIIKRIF